MLSTKCSLVKRDKKEKKTFNIKEKKMFHSMIHTNGGGGGGGGEGVETNYTKCIGVKSMGKAYKARAAEGYYNSILCIHIYLSKTSKKKNSFRSQYKIMIINHSKL